MLACQVESDIAPYKGLLMGLFFMTVGMQISVGLFIAKVSLVFVSQACAATNAESTAEAHVACRMFAAHIRLI